MRTPKAEVVKGNKTKLNWPHQTLNKEQLVLKRATSEIIEESRMVTVIAGVQTPRTAKYPVRIKARSATPILPRSGKESESQRIVKGKTRDAVKTK